jgi:hypothetical protein
MKKEKKILELVPATVPGFAGIEVITQNQQVTGTCIVVKETVEDKKTKQTTLKGVYAITPTARLRIDKVIDTPEKTKTCNIIIDCVAEEVVSAFQERYADTSTVELHKVFSNEPEEI